VYEGLLGTAQRLGIDTTSLQTTSGRTQFGPSVQALTRAIASAMDEQYGLWDELVGQNAPPSSPAMQQLRKIAAARGLAKNQMTRENLMAKAIEGYLYAGKEMRKTAPTVYARLNRLVRGTPDVADMAKIEPGLELTKVQAQRYVVLPIMGYRIVTKPHADIINNHLSASLYNNPYVGSFFRSWMSFANVLNMSQLGGGSQFHTGFTTSEVTVSTAARAVDSVYRMLTGQASPAEVARSLKKIPFSDVRVPVTGDRVLNAWRARDGSLDWRVEAAARAAEL